ncbi:hypothetical protein WJX73_007107 [Symbiochloris irregularis]|uniref:Uncharacterized protein n=1 Tax=Symbiochloris irregularis TaxID=706552 RepID=A0AAW1PZI3_9CHLO
MPTFARKIGGAIKRKARKSFQKVKSNFEGCLGSVRVSGEEEVCVVASPSSCCAEIFETCESDISFIGYYPAKEHLDYADKLRFERFEYQMWRYERDIQKLRWAVNQANYDSRMISLGLNR